MRKNVVTLLCCAFVLAARSAVALPVAAVGQDESTRIAVVGTEPSSEQITPEIAEPAEATAEITAEPVMSTAENAVETTTEPVQSTTENTVETTTEPVQSTTENAVETTTVVEIPVNKLTDVEVVKDKMSEQIRKILRHYQKSDPVGFPGAPIPDPLSIPPMKKNFGLADMTFFNMTVHGLSKFKVESVDVDLKKMQVYVLLKIRRMYVFGNYTLKSWFGRPAAGPFNVTLIDVDAEAAAALEPDEYGHLQAAETDMDMRFKDCELDFKNLGFTASMFQGIISSVGSVMFDGIKPFIINEVNTNLRADVNAQVKAITSRLPKINVPVPDMAIAEGRAYVQRMGYDPYRLVNRSVSQGPLNFTATQLTICGLSDFRRVGDIGLTVRGPVLQMTVHVITNAVNGSLRWKYELGLAKAFGRTGVSNFTVEHIQIRAVVNQTLDIRNKPVLDDLDIEVGKIAVQMDRREPLDYVVEVAVNSLPTLLRHIIVDVLEEPIKVKVQTLLDEVQVEKLVEERLPELDRLAGD